ncbi:MAG: discoidin domain-containing protein, partial [Candidatus Brocadiae bacterium]|nr:discoidin domain-containing protein [Candidatus Brocadiia bacterium]
MMNKHFTLAALLGLCLLATQPAHAVVINVARLGTAFQSSYRAGSATEGDHAQYALDGNTDPIFANGSITHTNTETAPWWYVDLHATRTIDTINVYNRDEGFESRLTGYQVSILDAAMNPVYTNTSPAFPNLSTSIPIGGIDGRYVRIDLPGSGKVLSLAEVEVMADVAGDDPIFLPGHNITRLGTATQSSTRFGAPKGNQPILAIDGNPDGLFSNLSVTHTNTEANPWWRVDLGSVQNVDSVQLHERADGCCNQLLNNFNVSVLDAGLNPVATVTQAGNITERFWAQFPQGTQGQYVQVQLNHSSSLQLAEVEAFYFEGNVINAARNPLAIATQSSTAFGGVASRAIDGNTDGNWGSGSTTHTAGEPGSWWEVDLGREFLLKNIQLFNRSDCCGGRLSDFRVTALLHGTTTGMWDFFTAGGSVAQGASFLFDAVTVADTVRIELVNINDHGDHVLSLAEVQIFGAISPEPGTLSLLALGGLG